MRTNSGYINEKQKFEEYKIPPIKIKKKLIMEIMKENKVLRFNEIKRKLEDKILKTNKYRFKNNKIPPSTLYDNLSKLIEENQLCKELTGENDDGPFPESFYYLKGCRYAFNRKLSNKNNESFQLLSKKFDIQNNNLLKNKKVEYDFKTLINHWQQLIPEKKLIDSDEYSIINPHSGSILKEPHIYDPFNFLLNVQKLTNFFRFEKELKTNKELFSLHDPIVDLNEYNSMYLSFFNFRKKIIKKISPLLLNNIKKNCEGKDFDIVFYNNQDFISANILKVLFKYNIFKKNNNKRLLIHYLNCKTYLYEEEEFKFIYYINFHHSDLIQKESFPEKIQHMKDDTAFNKYEDVIIKEYDETKKQYINKTKIFQTLTIPLFYINTNNQDYNNIWYILDEIFLQSLKELIQNKEIIEYNKKFHEFNAMIITQINKMKDSLLYYEGLKY